MALNRELAGITKIIVAQRVASVKDADKILVLEDGQLAAWGTHAALLETSPVYGEIFRSQMKREV